MTRILLALLLLGCTSTNEFLEASAPDAGDDANPPWQRPRAGRADAAEATPDAGTSKVEVPDAEAPDAEAPDAEAPDAEIPDAAVPDAEIPDAEIPDAAVPDAAVPDAAIPDAAIPDAEVPDAEVPDAAAPRIWPFRAPGPCSTLTVHEEIRRAPPRIEFYEYDDYDYTTRWRTDTFVNGTWDAEMVYRNEYDPNDFLVLREEIPRSGAPTLRLFVNDDEGRPIEEQQFLVGFEEFGLLDVVFTTYDEAGRLLTRTRERTGVGVSTRELWVYDDFGRPLTYVDMPVDGFVETRLDYTWSPDGTSVDIARDEAGAFVEETGTFGNWADGNPESITTETYDANGHLITSEYRPAGGPVTNRETRTWDDVGNPLTVETDWPGGAVVDLTVTYGYDCWMD